jgi:predicted RNA-binding protein
MYGVHTLRVRLIDDLGSTKETIGTFYAIDLPSPNVILSRL